ncbi:MAG: hypothetical protein BWY89_00885 [Bacteroidetes bacterium ADurb.BinA012]|nr:MAG: hypothetical protein BWY89_00885 [Bacteroidetes bacterium ADurb.BinA012]
MPQKNTCALAVNCLASDIVYLHILVNRYWSGILVSEFGLSLMSDKPSQETSMIMTVTSALIFLIFKLFILFSIYWFVYSAIFMLKPRLLVVG